VRFDIADPADLPPGAPFTCTAGLCLARHPSGALIALADNRKTARPACAFADLIVIDDATAYYKPCRNPLVLVVTKRQPLAWAVPPSSSIRYRRRRAQKSVLPSDSHIGLGMSSGGFRARRGACRHTSGPRNPRSLPFSNAGSVRRACPAP
jgi:hypothetical protein